MPTWRTSRRIPLGWLPAVSFALVLAASTSADVVVKQKTVSEGLAGFGDGTTISTFSIAGDKSRSEDEYTYTGRFKTLVGKKPHHSLSIVRLDKELVWAIDLDKKQYTELTFAEMREAMERGAAELDQASKENAKPKDAGMTFTVDVKKTGAHQEISGFRCDQVVITCTGKPEKPKQGEENADIRMVFDLWLTSQAAGHDELEGFGRKYAEKLGLDRSLSGVPAMARAMYGNGMKEMATKLRDVKGWPVRSTFTIEGPQATPEQQKAMAEAQAEGEKAKAEAGEQQASQEKQQDAQDATVIGSEAASGRDVKGSIGGLLGRKLAGMASKKAAQKAESGAASGTKSAGGPLLKVVTEVTEISSVPAAAGGFDLPAGYQKVARQ